MNVLRSCCSSGQHRGWLTALTVLLCFLTAWIVLRRPLEPPEQLLQAGLQALQTGDTAALRRVQQSLRRQAAQPEQTLLEAQESLQRGDYALARRLSRDAAQLRPQLRDLASAVQVEACYKDGLLAEAQATVRSWLERSPEQPTALRWAAAIEYDLGAMELAVQHLQALIQLRPEDAQARYLLGLIFHDYARYAEAIDALSGLLQLAVIPPDMQLDAQLRLGDCHIRLHRYPEALQVLQSLTTSAVAMARCAESHRGLGDMAQARSFSNKAAAIDPAQPEVLAIHAQLQMDDRDYTSAVATLSSLLQRDPTHVQAHHQLAQCYRLLGRTAEADQQLQRHAQVQQQMLQLSELHREALLHPQDAERRDQIAAIHAALGQQEQAAMWRRAAAACRQSADQASVPTANLAPVLSPPPSSRQSTGHASPEEF